MIRAIGSDDDGLPVVMLGLDEENLRRLTVDEPIKVNLADLAGTGQMTGLPAITVVIFHATPETTAHLREAAEL